MNYRDAAGRNWSTPRPRRRAVKLGQARSPLRLPETLPPPGRLEHRDAAGRNWSRQRPARRPARLAPSEPRPYPLREAGGGDHDGPYEFRGPSATWPFPFTSRAYGRLLILRGRIGDGDFADDLTSAEPLGA